VSNASTPVDSQTHIAVIIPMYNAQDHIVDVLRGIPSFVRTIIVVDDASPDDSAARVQQLADPRVRLVRHSRNQGVGGAMLTGYQTAIKCGAEILVKMDSDDQMDPAFLLPLIAPILRGEADCAKGNRFLHARELSAMPLQRRIGNIGLSFLTKMATGYWNIFDPTNGYTAIHAIVFPLLNLASIDRRYFFESSMLLELGLVRAVVQDVSIPARYAGEKSHLSEWKSLLQFPPRLVAGFLRRLWVQYFLRDFGVFSVFLVSGSALFAFGAIFGAYHWWLYAWQFRVASPTGTIMLSVLPIILGVQLLLQAIVLDVQNVPSKPLQKLINR